MYTEISLKLSEHEVHTLASGHPVRITGDHFSGGGAPLCVTSTQLKQLKKVADGKQKYTSLKLSAACIKRCAKQFGGSFLGSVGSFLKKTFTTPSGILGVASMLPTPLSTPLKAASVVAKLTGHGTGARFTSASHRVRPTEHCAQIDSALMGMGFRPHHIAHMKGTGVFTNIWSGLRKLGTILKPYIEKEGHRLVQEYGPAVARGAARHASSLLKSYMGGSASHQYVVKFTKPQLDYIKREMTGHGIFSDISSIGGNLITIGSAR